MAIGSKLVAGNGSSEGSQPANSGTDSLSRIHFGKQELDTRLDKTDEQAQLVPGIGIIVMS